MSEQAPKKKGCLASTFGLMGRGIKWCGRTYAGLWRKSKAWGKVVLILVPLMLCGLLGAFGESGDPTPTPTAQSATKVAEADVVAAPLSTDTQAPSRTPKPSKTPRPSRTPAPTRTPTDTPAPTPTLTEAETYFAAVLP